MRRKKLLELDKINESVVICSVIKNIAKFLPYSLKLLQETGKLFDKYHIVIYENNSTDSTKQILEQNKIDNCSIIMENIPYDVIKKDSKIWSLKGNSRDEGHPCRIEQISKARNKVVDIIRKDFFKNFTYVIWVDIDTIFWDLLGIHYVFTNKTKWDIVYGSSNRYYDYYALRTKNRYGPEVLGNFWDNNKRHFFPNNFQEVDSAFNGIGIYKKEIFDKLYFDFIVNEDVKKFYRSKMNEEYYQKIKNVIENNRKFHQKGYKDKNSNIHYKINSGYDNVVICEHVCLNFAAKNLGYRIFVSNKLKYKKVW